MIDCMKHSLVLNCAVFLALAVFSPVYASPPTAATPFVSFFERASARWGPPREVLWAIADQESSYHPWTINVEGKAYYPNDLDSALRIIRRAERENKSYDFGLMQINCWWLSYLGLRAEDVLTPAVNVHLGAWILAKEIERYGGLHWKSIGSYHTPASRNPARAKEYANRIMNRLDGGL